MSTSISSAVAGDELNNLVPSNCAKKCQQSEKKNMRGEGRLQWFRTERTEWKAGLVEGLHAPSPRDGLRINGIPVYMFGHH